MKGRGSMCSSGWCDLPDFIFSNVSLSSKTGPSEHIDVFRTRVRFGLFGEPWKDRYSAEHSGHLRRQFFFRHTDLSHVRSFLLAPLHLGECRSLRTSSSRNGPPCPEEEHKWTSITWLCTSTRISCPLSTSRVIWNPRNAYQNVFIWVNTANGIGPVSRHAVWFILVWQTCCRSQRSTESTEILRPNHGRKGTAVFNLASCFHGGNFEYQGVTIGSDENGVQLD